MISYYQYDNAITAYLLQVGDNANIPNHAHSTLVNGVWYFRNVNGYLGKVSARTGKLFGGAA